MKFEIDDLKIMVEMIILVCTSQKVFLKKNKWKRKRKKKKHFQKKKLNEETFKSGIAKFKHWNVIVNLIGFFQFWFERKQKYKFKHCFFFFSKSQNSKTKFETNSMKEHLLVGLEELVWRLKPSWKKNFVWKGSFLFDWRFLSNEQKWFLPWPIRQCN